MNALAELADELTGTVITIDPRKYMGQALEGVVIVTVDNMMCRQMGCSTITVWDHDNLEEHNILNWYKHPISTGKLEVMNRKIGMLHRQACGYRDDKYLKLRILHLHKTTYALTG